MFGIEFFVGSKFGGWLMGAERFATDATARDDATRQAQAERSRDITPFKRRVRKA